MTRTAPLKILKASAGSGKTFSLTIHYLTLLLHKENSYREILAVTFTNKATAEMKERILSVLQGLALGDESKKIGAFRAILLEQQPDWSSAFLQEKAARVYRKILHDYSRFTISTIDGFSQKVIRSFTYELNLDAGYKIEMNLNKVKADLTVMLNQLLDERPDLLDWIIEYAEEKIAKNESWNYRAQLMKLAGLIFSENFQEFSQQASMLDAGKVFSVLQQQVEQQSAVFFEAFNLAVRNMKELYQSFGLDESALKGKSRNTLIKLSKLPEDFTQSGIKDIDQVFSQVASLRDNENNFIEGKVLRSDVIQAYEPVIALFDELQVHFSRFIAYQALRENLYYLRLLNEMSGLLGKWRKDNGAQLISDAQLLLNEIGLDQHSDPTFIWEKIGNRFRYFLFDEFQDTSRIQWKNYSPLLINALGQSEGKLHEHLIVGDVKQSIYRWRNGDWRILLHGVEKQVATAFHLPEAELSSLVDVDSLEVNYRSLPQIIHFNNFLYHHLPMEMQRALNHKVEATLDGEARRWWQESGNADMLVKAYENSSQQVPKHKLSPLLPQGVVDVRFLPVENNMQRVSRTVDEAMRILAEQVGEWISSGRYQPGKIGILVRTNGQALRVVEELMRYKTQSGMSFDILSGDALTVASDTGVMLLIETLKALIYTTDEYVIHHAKMAYLYGLLREGVAFEQDAWLLFKGNDLQGLQSLLPKMLLEKWDDFHHWPLVHLVEKLIECYGLTAEHNAHLPYILAFKELVSSFSSNGEKGIGQFITYWEEDGGRAVLPSSDGLNAVEVLTIHKSKGLAFDVVMIPFAAWEMDGRANAEFWVDIEDRSLSPFGRVPMKYSAMLGSSVLYQQYFEEMLFNYMDAINTFYVATTRAVEHLYILAPSQSESRTTSPNDTFVTDVLRRIMRTGVDGYRLDENEEFHIGDLPPSGDEQVFREDRRIALLQYPISNQLEAALEKKTNRSMQHIMTLESTARYGTLAHEILSLVESLEEALSHVGRYVEEGVLSRAEEGYLVDEIKAIWNHPVINSWLDGTYRVWNESSIITSDGATIRPDKVFTRENETIVLDFKFTQGDYIGHKTQVDTYVNTLKAMGYKGVRGFLYYAKSKSLEEVS